MTLRAFLIGIAWVVLQSLVAPYNNYAVRSSSLGGNLPLASFLILSFLSLVANPVAQRVKPSARLNSLELGCIWIMSAVASVIPLRGLVGFLLPLLAAPVYFATPENDWEALIVSAIPSWAIVTDRQAARQFFERPLSGAPHIPWDAWARPLAFWLCFGLVCFVLLYCLACLLRRPWVERERFGYPLVRLPVELARHDAAGASSGVFSDKLLWIGALLPVVLHTVNGLHQYVPAAPAIPTRIPLTGGLNTKPWAALDLWPAIIVMVYPAVIGVCYLLPLGLSFSLWFFFFVYKAQYAAISAFAIPVGPWIAASRQSMGAILVIAASLIWLSRGHIVAVIRCAVGSRHTVDDTREYLPYRWAVLAAAASVAVMTAMCVYAGADAWVVLIVLALFVTVSTVLGWMVASGGMLVAHAPFYPSDYMMILQGTRVIGARNLPLLAIPQHSLMRAWEQFMMAQMLHGVRVAETLRLRRWHLVGMVAAATVVGLVASSAATLHMAYAEGALNTEFARRWFSRAPYERAVSLIQDPQGVPWVEVYSLCIGVVATVVMLAFRYRFAWFALHPIGYAVGCSSPSYYLWASVMIAWIVKSGVIRLGGPRVYGRGVPLFIGLIFGDYAMAGVWVVVGLITGQGYNILPTGR